LNKIQTKAGDFLFKKKVMKSRKIFGKNFSILHRCPKKNHVSLAKKIVIKFPISGFRGKNLEGSQGETYRIFF